MVDIFVAETVHEKLCAADLSGFWGNLSAKILIEGGDFAAQ